MPKLICFDLKKAISSIEDETKVNEAIDAIVEKYGLSYVIDGHYKLSEECDSEETIAEITKAVEENEILREYISISVWQIKK